MVPEAKGQEPKQQKDPRARQAAISVHLQTSHRPPPPRASPHTGDTTLQEQGIWPFPACTTKTKGEDSRTMHLDANTMIKSMAESAGCAGLCL